jgi:ParB-like chromosome segregation protein Spo0J
MVSTTLESKQTATAVDMPPADALIHPAADIFRTLSDADYAELRHDIELHGILEPIWVDPQGQVLDGRHRLRAAHELGITCSTLVYDGPDPIGFVFSLNFHRRHLTTSQRAMVAAKMAALRQGRPSKKTPQKSGVSTKQAAEKFHVGTRTVESGKTVLKHGAPEIIRAVESGEMRVGRAAVLAAAAIERPQTNEVSNLATSEKVDSQKVKKVEIPASAPPRPRVPLSRAAVLHLRNELVGALEQIRCEVRWTDRKRFLDELSDYHCEALALTRKTWTRRLGGDSDAPAAPAGQHNRKEHRHG